jgi:hypothetical protein
MPEPLSEAEIDAMEVMARTYLTDRWNEGVRRLGQCTLALIATIRQRTQERDRLRGLLTEARNWLAIIEWTPEGARGAQDLRVRIVAALTEVDPHA